MKEKFFIYQIFPRLFGNDNPTRKENGTIEENGCGKFSKFTAKALSEIKKMGFSHIWFTGALEHATKTDYSSLGIPKDHPDIVKGNAGSPYAIKDYYDVDPDLADNVAMRMAEFEDLIARSHKAGLKVIIDFVPNHVARQYRSDTKPRKVADLGGKDDWSEAFSPDNNFYYLPGESLHLHIPRTTEKPYNESPARVTGNDCFHSHPGVNDWYETAKLNYGVDYRNGHQKYFTPIPDTWIKMRDILLFWTAKGVDGFRCDMAEMVPVEFWSWVIQRVKEKNEQIIFIAEIYNPQEYGNYIYTGRFDYLYDKVGLYDTFRHVITGQLPTSEITFCWQRLQELQPNMLNFLENHDEQRIASDFFGGDARKGIPGMLVSASLNTNPVMVYFGQELGERGMDKEGFSGLDGRTTIFDYWQIESVENWRNGGKFGNARLTPEQIELREFYIKLIGICNKEEAIKDGLFYDLMYANYENQRFDSTKQYAFLRAKANELILVVSNFSENEVNLLVDIPKEAFEYLQIDPKRISGYKELLFGGTKKTKGLPGGQFEESVGGYSGKIFKFLLN
ncbi:MAG: alpha-amylase [Bacteroidales bacterium 45-6]|nr:MAG: alpha-amylase [Bacteroidales bacterium 45-6]